MCEKPKKSWVWHECISKPQLWVMWKIKQTSANNCHLLTTDVVLYTFTDCASFTPKKIFFEQNKLIFVTELTVGISRQCLLLNAVVPHWLSWSEVSSHSYSEYGMVAVYCTLPPLVLSGRALGIFDWRLKCY